MDRDPNENKRETNYICDSTKKILNTVNNFRFEND